MYALLVMAGLLANTPVAAPPSAKAAPTAPPYTAPAPSAAPAPMGAEQGAAGGLQELDAQNLDAPDLDAIVGREGSAFIALSEQNLSATNTGNMVSGQTVISGEVNFGPGSLQNFNGVGNFVVNTGANNNLQGAINITIVTGPGL